MSNRQFILHTQERARLDLKKLHAYIAVIRHAVEQCRQAYLDESKELTRGNTVAAWCGGYAQTFNSTLASLGALAAHELADPDLVVAYTFILGEMKNISGYLEKHSLIDEPDELEDEFFLLSLESSVRIIDMQWSEFERFLEDNPVN